LKEDVSIADHIREEKDSTLEKKSFFGEWAVGGGWRV
jgi:hypothetical protein